jgi:hypothetical protein
MPIAIDDATNMADTKIRICLSSQVAQWGERTTDDDRASNIGTSFRQHSRDKLIGCCIVVIHPLMDR